MDTQDTNIHEQYNELWNFNLRKIKEIHNDIDKTRNELESEYDNFEKIYDKIENLIGLLSSIYSSFNTIDGNEYIKRLNAVINSYKKRYTRDGIDFNLVDRLLVKISDVRDKSFSRFPVLAHDNTSLPTASLKVQKSKNFKKRPYKWISFQRNGSWFLTRFTSLAIIPGNNCRLVSKIDNDLFKIKTKNKTFTVRDIFSKSDGTPDKPKFYILLNKGIKNYAVNVIGEKIYSEKDMMIPLLKPFHNISSSPLTPGRVRIFGKNHILLN